MSLQAVQQLFSPAASKTVYTTNTVGLSDIPLPGIHIQIWLYLGCLRPKFHLGKHSKNLIEAKQYHLHSYVCTGRVPPNSRNKRKNYDKGLQILQKVHSTIFVMNYDANILHIIPCCNEMDIFAKVKRIISLSIRKKSDPTGIVLYAEMLKFLRSLWWWHFLQLECNFI